jgi:hypothetical protein
MMCINIEAITRAIEPYLPINMIGSRLSIQKRTNKRKALASEIAESAYKAMKESGGFYIEVGDFYLTAGYAPGRVWIMRKDGEGGDFDTKKLEKIISKFYNANF